MRENLVTQGGTACPLCFARSQRQLDLSDFQLYRCNNCGCWSSNALANGVQTSFENPNYFQNGDADKKRWEAFVEQYVPKDSADFSVLDFGCGTGPFLQFMEKTRPLAKVYGIELDKGRAQDAKEKAPKAEVFQGFLPDFLKTNRQKFDAITLWDVFEHLDQPREYLEMLAQVLKPGGTIIVQTIFEHSLLPTIGRISYKISGGLLKGPARRTHDAHHIVFFTKFSLEKLCRELGLQIAAVEYDHLAFERTDGPWLVRTVAAALMNLERLFGRGLFITLTLKK